MKRTSVFSLLLALIVSLPAIGQTTKAWWNFDDGTANLDLYTHGVNEGFTLREGAIDLSGNGYHMKAYGVVEGPKFSADGATPTGFGLSSQYTGSQDGYLDYADMTNWSPSQWTIEFSFNSSSISGNKTFIGRDGEGGFTGDGNISALYVQTLNGSGLLRIQWVTVSDERITMTSTFGAVVNKWYNVAITCDGTNVRFYVDSLDGNGYVEYSSADPAITSNGGVAGQDHSMKPAGIFIFGQGFYKPLKRVDKYSGLLDDVRLTDGVRPTTDFLHAQPMVANPSPAVGATLVSLGSDLSWSMLNASTVDHYKVFVSADPNDWDPNAFETAQDEGRYLTVTDTTAALADFNQFGTDYITFSKNYKWRVDAYLTASGTPVKSALGSFTTVPDAVVIITQPKSVTANPNATFSVVASGAKRYEWKKFSTGAIVGTESTLTINNATLADEDDYFCVMYNGLTPETTTSTETSNMVHLWTQRLAGYWPFDADLTDAVASEVAGAPAHNGALGTHTTAPANTGDGQFVFAEGCVDNAISFTNDSDYVAIEDQEFQNYYVNGFTLSLWYKFNGTTNPGWRLPMSKLEAGVDGWLFGVDASARAQFIIEKGNGALYSNTGASVNDGEWHLLTATYDPATDAIVLYVDGLASEVRTYDLQADGVPTAPLSIGGRNTENSVYGMIDEVRAYTYPMTQIEIIDNLYIPISGEGVCISPIAGGLDLVADCKIDLKDLAKLAAAWLDCGRYPESSCN